MKIRIDESPKKLTFMGLLDAVFGKVAERAPSNKRRCFRCGRKYDRTKIKFATDTFCSQECAKESPAVQAKMTRQEYRHGLRLRAKEEIARKMGVGPRAMNPRRARRRAALKLAQRIYREQKGAEVASQG